MSSFLETDAEEVARALTTLIAPGDVFEIRCLHASKYRSMQGFFDDPVIATDAILQLENNYKGIYVTLNPIKHDVIYRANNEFVKFNEGLGAKDSEIVGRNWLPVDIDPIRASGISSTNQERRAALKRAVTIADTLELTYGFPEPVLASSGNGSHLLYPCAFPNNDQTRDAVKEFIRKLDSSFSDNVCQVDTSVFNASRIWRVYGTVARKGSDAPERPHRHAKILNAPGERNLLSYAAVRHFGRASVETVERAAKSSVYPSDEARWRLLNRAALKSLDWVEQAFGDDARPYMEGFRISSEALGRDREEDLSIQPLPLGIVDFGEHDMDDAKEGHRTPISVLAEFVHDNDKQAAATWLAAAIGEQESEFEGIADKYQVKGMKDADDAEDYLLGDEPHANDPDYYRGFHLASVRNGVDIAKRVYGAKRYIVDGLLPCGAYVLISRPKMGKSWLALQLALAAIKGGHFLGNKVKKTKVLMLSLEEQESRVQGRIKVLNGGKMPSDGELANLFIVPLDALVDNQFPRGEAGCQVIRKLIEQDPEIGLIIIDTFTLFRDHDAMDGGNAYDRDYASVMPLVRLRNETGVSVLAVHHERKGATIRGKTDIDFMEAASGSAGLTAAFEGTLRIEGVRDENDDDDEDLERPGEEDGDEPHIPVKIRKLKIAGRDIERDVIVRSMAFSPLKGGWYRTGALDCESEILRIIRQNHSCTFTDVCALIPNIPKNEIKRKLLEMVNEGTLDRVNNQYTLLHAGDDEQVPEGLLTSEMSMGELVLRVVEWHGVTEIGFLYDTLKGYGTANATRSACAYHTKQGNLMRPSQGKYKITKRGTTRNRDAERARTDDGDDDGDLDDLL